MKSIKPLFFMEYEGKERMWAPSWIVADAIEINRTSITDLCQQGKLKSMRLAEGQNEGILLVDVIGALKLLRVDRNKIIQLLEIEAI